MKLIVFRGVGLSLILAAAAIPAAAQNQTTSNSTGSPAGTSLGDYARQVRKGSGDAAKSKVFDNDNLPKNDKLSVVGKPADADENPNEPKQDDSAAAPASGEAKTGSENKPAATSASPEEDQAAKQQAWKQWADKLSAQKDQIDLLQREFDVLQREYQIRAAEMYSDVGNRLRNSADWDQKDAQYKQQIADKQKAVDDAKQKLDDMQEEARKAGVPSSVREP
ncbi:MAG TPA: hypothetical protein VGG04_14720 [Candidatus Sulfotelmatobacter sp.]|jgi:hypothetical protein